MASRRRGRRRRFSLKSPRDVIEKGFGGRDLCVTDERINHVEGEGAVPDMTGWSARTNELTFGSF